MIRDPHSAIRTPESGSDSGSRSANRETTRQIVHITMVGWALLLRVLTWQQAALLAAVALIFNAFVLPRIGGRALMRPPDLARGAAAGILFYPLSVLLLILVFRTRLDIVAAAWGILALGDGMATVVGRAARGRAWPWNPQKTIAGTLAFMSFGGAAGALLCWWAQPNVARVGEPAVLFVVGAPVVAAIVAALVESIPAGLDDNLSVPFAAASTLWVLSLVDPAVVDAMAPGIAGRLVPALLVNGGFALVAYLEHVVSRSGLVAGALIGIVVYLGAGWEGWLMLVAAFIAATATSKVGWERKVRLGIAEARAGRRGAGNALANCLVSAVAAIVAITSPYQEAAWLALVTGLTAGAADTVASEIGKAWGTRTVLAIGFRPVPPGTSGAISLEGSLANVVGAFVMAVLAAALGLIAFRLAPLVVCAALAGSYVESILAATFEHRGILNNDLLNFITTAVAVAVALALWQFGVGR